IVEYEQSTLAADDGLQRHLAPPQTEQIGERPLRIFEVEVATVVVMLQIERAVVSVAGVFDLNDRHASHADVLDQRLLDLLPSVLIRNLGDDQIVALRLVLEEIHLAHQFLGQESSQERRVAVGGADVEELLQPRALLAMKLPRLFGARIVEAAADVFPDLEA